MVHRMKRIEHFYIALIYDLAIANTFFEQNDQGRILRRGGGYMGSGPPFFLQHFKSKKNYSNPNHILTLTYY